MYIRILQLIFLLSATISLNAQTFPFDKYYLMPAGNSLSVETFRILEFDFGENVLQTKLVGIDLSNLKDGQQEVILKVDTIVNINNLYHFIFKKEGTVRDRFRYTTIMINTNKTEYRSALLWQVNTIDTDFNTMDQLVEYIKNDKLIKLYAPLYSKSDAEKFRARKSLDQMKEHDLLKILRKIKERKDFKLNIYYSLSEDEKKKYIVHKLFKASMYGASFFEDGYDPIILEQNVEEWQLNFNTNNELINLLGKLF